MTREGGDTEFSVLPMLNFELVSFADDRSLAQAVADRWLKDLGTVNRKGVTYCVALSGGRVARRFLVAASEQAQRRSLAFDGVHFFWGDERCVSPSDSESNYALAKEHFLEPLKIKADQIHRVRGEDDPVHAAQAAEEEICRIAPMNEAGQPVLDLIFLGMGEDGHVASLFPEAPVELFQTKTIYHPVLAAKPPPRRITMSYEAIAAARQVWVIASGPGKETALRESIGIGGKTPLGRVLQMRAKTDVFTDIRVSG